MALGWTPLSWASTVLNASAARANASRGCAQISNRLEVTPPAANSPAITADAFDSSAKAKFFSSSTKTRSPGTADCKLATRLTCAAPSPTTRAPINSASSDTERFMAPFYTFASGKERAAQTCRG